jgi:hypothetical protein
MVVRRVRKFTNFLFNVVSGGCCSEYLAISGVLCMEAREKLASVVKKQKEKKSYK